LEGSNLRGSPEAESEILAQILSLRDDPVGFVHYAIPWGRPDTPFANFKGPRAWQLEELEHIGEHTRKQVFAIENGLPLQVYKGAYSSGRGPGKSALFGMVALWAMSTRLGAPVIVSANVETQLRTKTFPEFATWFGAAINSHWYVLESLKISPAPWLVDLIKKLPEEGGLGIDPKYWAVIGQNWSEESPDSFAGAHNPYGMTLLFDEAAGIHSRIFEVSEGFFTETNPYRYWLCASQMRRREGRLYEIFNDPKMGEGWHTRTLSTRGMPGVDQVVVEDQIRRYGADSDFVRVEIDGLPPRTSEDQFISWDSVRQAQNNDLNRDYGEPLILGVDPAPRGKTAWRFRQGRNARDCCGSATHGFLLGHDNVQIAQKILELDSKFKPDAICIDFGLGTGVIDILKRKKTHGQQHEVRFGDQANDKSSEWATHAIELWARLREWLPGGMIEKDSGEKGSLSQQMTDRGWRWSGREDGKKILETKDELQRRGVKSPDDVDALACTLEVNPPRSDSRKLRGGDVQIADGTDTSITD
jgi:hypothetical protein